MSVNLPAKVEDYTALQSQSSFTTAEKAIFKELHAYITDHAKESIWWYWELGQKVKEAVEKAEADQTKYGSKLLLRLAKALGYQTDSQLRNAQAVVKTFNTKKAMSAYLKMRGEAGNALHWSHMVYLAAIGDDGIRKTTAAQTLEQCWTAAQLWSHVKELVSRKPRGIRRSSAKVPTSARQFFSHVFAQADKFVEHCDTAWSAKAFDIKQAVDDIPADKLNEKFCESVRNSIARVDTMRKKAVQLLVDLRAAESVIDEHKQAQAAYNRQAAADAAAAAAADTEGDDSNDVAEAPEVDTTARAERAQERSARRKRGKVGASS